MVEPKRDSEGMYFIKNLLFLLAKYHIHKCKFSGSKAFFPGFKNEVNDYLDIKYSKNCKALRTVQIYSTLVTSQD